MTTMTPAATELSPRAGTTRLTFGGVLHSEWIKLRSLRSTVWSYAIVVVIAIGMAVLLSLSIHAMNTSMPDESTDEMMRQMVTSSAMFGVYFAQMVVAVLGVLVISGEYATGMIRSTITAVPKRLPALAGKGVILFAATFVVGLVSNLGGFIVASIVFGPESAPFDGQTVLAICAGALFLSLVALFALGVGTMVRNSAGGISIVLGILLLLPIVLNLIPVEWAHNLTPYTLSAAGQMIYMGIGVDPSTIEGQPNSWQSLLIVLGWVAVSLAGAAVLLKRRDA